MLDGAIVLFHGAIMVKHGAGNLPASRPTSGRCSILCVCTMMGCSYAELLDLARQPTAWKVILFAVAFGPPIGVIFLLVPFWVRNWEDVGFILLMGYLLGLVPSLIGGALFAALRPYLGSGYWCAGFSGGTATAICAILLLGTSTWPSAIIYLAGFAGVLPALGARLLAQRWFSAAQDNPDVV